MKELTFKEIDIELFLNSFILVNGKETTIEYRAAEHYDKYLRQKLKELRNETVNN